MRGVYPLHESFSDSKLPAKMVPIHFTKLSFSFPFKQHSIRVKVVLKDWYVNVDGYLYEAFFLFFLNFS